MPPYKPYKSRKQQKWAHTASGLAALGAEDVKGKDQSTNFKNLPEKVKTRKRGQIHH